MAWTNYTFTSGAILTSTQMTNVFNNFSAISSGDSGAPKVQWNAIDTDWSVRSLQQYSLSPGATHTPSSGFLFIDYIMAAGAVILELYVAGSWRSGCPTFPLIGSIVPCDGVNVRFKNTHASVNQTCAYRNMRV